MKYLLLILILLSCHAKVKETTSKTEPFEFMELRERNLQAVNWETNATEIYRSCDYKLPKGYKFFYNKNTGEYVISSGFGMPHIEYSFNDYKPAGLYFGSVFTDHPGVNLPFFMTVLNTVIGNAYRFKDTCQAKDTLRKFLIIYEDALLKRHQADSINHRNDSIRNDFRPTK